MSLIESPSILNTTTTIKIASPGKIISHGAVCIEALPSLSINPHSGAGGFAPNPKKESAASSSIIAPMSVAAVIINVGKAFGSIYLNSIYGVFEPVTIAADT